MPKKLSVQRVRDVIELTAEAMQWMLRGKPRLVGNLGIARRRRRGLRLPLFFRQFGGGRGRAASILRRRGQRRGHVAGPEALRAQHHLLAAGHEFEIVLVILIQQSLGAGDQ